MANERILIIDDDDDLVHVERLTIQARGLIVGGGINAFAASLRGIAAVIIDGGATDPSEMHEPGKPVYCRGLSAKTTKGLAREGEINKPLAMVGCYVRVIWPMGGS